MSNAIGVLGDTHGNTTWVRFALRKLHEAGAERVVQVGDFGVWPGKRGVAFANDVSKMLSKYGMELFVTEGNHDDYDQIDALPVAEDGWKYLRPNIRLAPRGHRWAWEDRTFVSLGGAPSVDRAYRLQGMGISRPEDIDKVPILKRTWWPQESITPEDVARTVAGGKADVMIGHDAPNGLHTITANIAGNPHGFTKGDLAYADIGRAYMTEAWMAVQPKIFLHGHYHFLVNEITNVSSAPFVRDILFRCHVLGVSCDGQPDALAVLDLDTLTVVPLVFDVFKEYWLRGK